MCGRYTLFTPEQEMEIRNIVKEAERRAKAANAPVAVKTGEIFPTDIVPVIKPETGRLGSFPMRWGFTKPWGDKGVLFNTRSDTATALPEVKKSNMWRESLHKRRCIIPTTGFYEWYHKNGKKQKGDPRYLFNLPNTPLLYLAGIYEEPAEKDVLQIEHFSIMTTDGSKNTSINAIHNRMPVVLLPEEYDEWLYGDYKKLLYRNNIIMNKKLA